MTNEIKLEDISEQDCIVYEKVRKSGKTNMWDITEVIRLSNMFLNKETIFAIMKNYTELNKRFNFRK